MRAHAGNLFIMPKNADYVGAVLFIAHVHDRSNGRTDGPSVLRPFVLPKSDAVDLASVRASKEHFEALHTGRVSSICYRWRTLFCCACVCMCVRARVHERYVGVYVCVCVHVFTGVR